jgi:hypothetical protein
VGGNLVKECPFVNGFSGLGENKLFDSGFFGADAALLNWQTAGRRV